MATEADATYPIYVVDAFTDKTFGGNPAAVIPFPAQGHGWLSDELLQKIAAENNLSETAFLVPDLEESSRAMSLCFIIAIRRYVYLLHMQRG